MSNSSAQHLAGVEIPDIEISDDWPVSEVKTIQDCDDAFCYLMSAVAQIEYQIETEELRHPAEREGEWLASARCALKYKKAALQMVGYIRGRIEKKAKQEAQLQADRILLDHIKKQVPVQQFQDWLRGAFAEKEAA